MSLRQNYVTEEPKEFTTLPKGDYPFIVSQVFAWENSKAGNEMLPIELTVGHAGATITRTEYLVFVETAKWKLDGFLKAIGLPVGQRVDWENLGWLMGKTGVCRLIEKTILKKNEPPGGATILVNEIEGYCYPGSKSHPANATPQLPQVARPRTPAPAPAVQDNLDDTPF